MKLFRKIIVFFIVISILSILGIYLYVRLSPKIIINNANKISFYDSNNEVFFTGSKDN